MASAGPATGATECNALRDCRATYTLPRLSLDCERRGRPDGGRARAQQSIVHALDLPPRGGRRRAPPAWPNAMFVKIGQTRKWSTANTFLLLRKKPGKAARWMGAMEERSERSSSKQAHRHVIS